jgi:hypothetical protein
MDMNPYAGAFDLPLPSPGAAQAAALRGQSLQQRIAEAQARQQAAMQEQAAAYAPIDRSGMEQAYQRRSQVGGDKMMLALAAGEAGKGMQPFQAQFLKQATEARDPMKMAGGTMTDTGFIEDPTYKQNLNIQRADAKVKQYDQALNTMHTQEENARLQVERDKAAADLRRELQANQQAFAGQMAGQASADRRYAVDVGSADKKAALAKDAKGTEGERSAAGFLGRMQAAEDNLRAIGAKGAPSLLTKSLGYTGMGGTARPYLEKPAQQTYRAAQEEWVRAKLRKESGAAIPTDEMDREIVTNFPQPGEGPEVVAQKAQTRAQAAEAMKTMSGPIRSARAAPVDGAPAPKAPPQIGEVRGGYTFNGGNPADPNSWSK